MTNVENKLLFILNPISGGIDKAQFKEQLHALCLEKLLEYEVLETTGDADEKQIKAKIKAWKPTTVVACGGDGTINLVGQVMLGSKIPMGIIPLGSANGMATELLITKDLQQNINVLLDGKRIEMDVIEINKKHLCFHLADIGFNARLIQEFDNVEGRGKLTYAWSFAKTILQKQGVRCRIKLPHREFKETIEMITFANATKYGTGALVNPTGKIDDGKYEICIFEPHPRWKLPYLTWLFFSGHLNSSKHVDIISTTETVVSLSRPQALQVDGEVIGEVMKVEARLHAKKLPLLVPKEYMA